MKNFILNLCILMFLGNVSNLVFFTMLTSDVLGIPIYGMIQFGYFMFFGFALISILVISYLENYQFEPIIWICLLIIGFSVMNSFAYYHNYPMRDLGLAVLKPIFVYTTLIGTYFLFREKEKRYRILLFYSFWIFLSGISYNIFFFIMGLKVPAAAYLCIPLLPLLLLFKRKYLVVLCYILTLFFLIFSGKRAGLIAMFGAFFVYYIVEYYFIRKKDIVFSTFLFAVAAGVLAFFIIQFNESANNILQERYIQAFETGGSGRLDLWRLSIEDFVEASVFRKIFGAGYYFFELETFHITPHNDILDILNTFGIVGLAIYLWFCKQLISTSINLVKRSHWLAPSFAVALFMFFVFSIFSIVAREVGSYSLLFAYFGFAYARLHVEKENPQLLLEKYQEQGIPFYPHYLPR